MNWKAIERDNIQFQSTINGALVSASFKAMHTMLKSRIIIEGTGMSIQNNTKRTIRPTHPGEMLSEDFMPDYGLTTASLAAALGVSRQSVNELLRGRRAVSPDMALRLARLFGNSPEFWLNAQQAVDLWDASAKLKSRLKRVQPLLGEKILR